MSNKQYSVCPNCGGKVNLSGKCSTCNEELTFKADFSKRLNIVFIIYVALKVIGSLVILELIEPENVTNILIYYIGTMLVLLLSTLGYMVLNKAEYVSQSNKI